MNILLNSSYPKHLAHNGNKRLDQIAKAYMNVGYTDLSSEAATCLDSKKQIYACAFEVPMEELTVSVSEEMLVEKIKDCRDVVLEQKH